MANEAATQEFRELVDSTKDGLFPAPAFGPMATYGIGNLAHGRLITSSNDVTAVASQPVSPQVHLTDANPNTHIALPSCQDRGASKEMPAKVASTVIPTSPRSFGHARVWGVQDRVEHALRRVDLAIWEQRRIEENLSIHQDGQGDDQSQVTSVDLQRLISRLTVLGLPPTTATNVAFLFRERNSQLGIRTSIDQTIIPSVELYGVLQNLNFTWRHSEVSPLTLIAFHQLMAADFLE